MRHSNDNEEPPKEADWPNGKPGRPPKEWMEQIQANLLEAAQQAEVRTRRWERAKETLIRDHPEIPVEFETINAEFKKIVAKEEAK